MTATREEQDSCGIIEVPKERLWGAQTSSLNITAYCAGLPTSTVTATSSETLAVTSSVPS